MGINTLTNKAANFRRKILDIVSTTGVGHIGGSLSCIDLITGLYYGGGLKYDPKKPNWGGRDIFILSKGHACLSLYVVLSDLGYFSEKELNNIGSNGCLLGGHPDRSIPGIEADTGSLGNGLGIGAGQALAYKKDKKKNKVVVLMGDGECYEGSVWEAAQFAAHHNLNNLIGIIDRNMQCVLNYTEDINSFVSIEDKWKAFGWEVISINGHSFDEIINAIHNINNRYTEKPLMIIANTVKGKGISFMEKSIKWHHGVPKGIELDKARLELNINNKNEKE